MAVTREVWGPVTWRFLHLSASLSDRNDVAALWMPFLKAMALVLPCDLCRQDMNRYVTQIRYSANPLTVTGPEVKDGVMRYMWAFHNSVNERLGKPTMTWEDVVGVYEGLGSREAKIAEAETLFPTLVAYFSTSPHLRRQGGLLTAWQNRARFLFALLASGPT